MDAGELIAGMSAGWEKRECNWLPLWLNYLETRNSRSALEGLNEFVHDWEAVYDVKAWRNHPLFIMCLRVQLYRIIGKLNVVGINYRKRADRLVEIVSDGPGWVYSGSDEIEDE
jgi:hypothetical protein